MRLVNAVLVLAAAFSLLGCTAGYHPHGQGRSNDTFTYISTSHEPKTITLVDTRSGEKLWTCEIPVGQQLVVRFLDDERAESRGWDTMKWRLMPAWTAWGTLDNAMSVPPNTARRIDMTLRKGPEFVVAEATPAPLPSGVSMMDAPKSPPATPASATPTPEVKPTPASPAAKPTPAAKPKPPVEPTKPAATEPPVKLPE